MGVAAKELPDWVVKLQTREEVCTVTRRANRTADWKMAVRVREYGLALGPKRCGRNWRLLGFVV